MLRACLRFHVYHISLGYFALAVKTTKWIAKTWPSENGTIAVVPTMATMESCSMGLIPDTQNCSCAGNAGNVSPPLRVSDPDIHHGMCVMHMPWCMSGSLTSGFLWSRWRGKRSRHSRRMRNQQFCESGKRPIGSVILGAHNTYVCILRAHHCHLYNDLYHHNTTTRGDSSHCHRSLGTIYILKYKKKRIRIT